MGEGGGAFGRALRGGNIAVDFGGTALTQPDLQQFQRADDAGEEIVEVVRDAAGELADGFHLLRLAQGFFGVLAFGDGLGHARFQRFVHALHGLIGPLARGDILKQHRDLAPAGRLDPERREFEIASGGDEFALEADRHARPQHRAVELGPAVGLVGHHLAQLLPDHVGDAGVQRVGRVGFDVDVVA